MNNQQEIWKDVVGYNGLYQVSNQSRMRRVKFVDGKFVYTILKPILKKNGYVQHGLCMNNKLKCVSLHRVVAQAFIPNPENKPTVNHINGIRDDNSIDNLEWATQKEQIKHAWSTGLSNYDYERKLKLSKIVVCLQSGIFFYSTTEAANALNIKLRSMRKMLSGEIKNKTTFVYA
jgi:hypothetical protein